MIIFKNHKNIIDFQYIFKNNNFIINYQSPIDLDVDITENINKDLNFDIKKDIKISGYLISKNSCQRKLLKLNNEKYLYF